MSEKQQYGVKYQVRGWKKPTNQAQQHIFYLFYPQVQHSCTVIFFIFIK